METLLTDSFTSAAFTKPSFTPRRGWGGGGRGGVNLVSLRIFGMGSHYTITILVSLSTVHKEIYKKCPDNDQPEISFRGQFKLEPYPHWSPLRV